MNKKLIIILSILSIIFLSGISYSGTTKEIKVEFKRVLPKAEAVTCELRIKAEPNIGVENKGIGSKIRFT
jgi:hypothetical protein